MAEVSEYVVSYWHEMWTITYGKCTRTPYVENGLWFVFIPPIQNNKVFFVTQEFVAPAIFEEFSLDLEKWASVAKLSLPASDWNPVQECRWRDMPYRVHFLPDGVPLRYGLSRTQSTRYPDREIWYVVVGLGYDDQVDWRTNDYPVFVVDKVCTTPAFMNRMGSDPERWRLISWESPVGIEPWGAVVDWPGASGPDPYYTFRQDEWYANRPWWQKILFPQKR